MVKTSGTSVTGLNVQKFATKVKYIKMAVAGQRNRNIPQVVPVSRVVELKDF